MSYYRYSNYSYYRPSFFGGFKFFPPVIKYLLISNVAIFILMSFFGLFRLQGLPLIQVIGTLFPLHPFGEGFLPWQLFTYMFMHGGFWHLFFNMFALWMFGMEMENNWGSKRFLIYYIVCGVGAGLVHLAVAPLLGQVAPTVGASGAVFGVLLAFGMLYPDRPVYIYFLLPIRAKYFITFWIGLELFYGVTSTGDGIAHFAHLGGAAVGLVYLLAERRKLALQNLWHRTKQRVVPTEHVNEYSTYQRRNLSDANYYDVHEKDTQVNQQQIDEILDKISQHGYQSLTEKEKKILFEASKKLN
ncbi:MAG: rhomboid family intramembrane serine protease [Ignavibacteriae bacterium]|nr:rhomboid family intramembrane serine protease [Ignavibacteriota bacterium]